jgi:uncharacterized protein (DUF342 family)
VIEQDFITIKAENMQIAIDKAKKELNVAEELLEIKVVSKGKQNILFHNEPVIIQARKKPQEIKDLVNDIFSKSTTDFKHDESVTDGYVEVINGKIAVKNPLKGGKYPTIEPGENIEVIVNGQPINERTVVVEEDIVEIICPDREPVVSYNVEISKDNIYAYLKTNTMCGYKYKFKDCQRILNAKIDVEATQKIPPQPIKKEEIIALLINKGIKHGIQPEAINSAIENVREGEEKVVLAVGTPCVEGKGAEIDYVFLNKLNNDKEGSNPYKGKSYMSVDVGEVLAVKKPVIEGKPGINIYGEIVAPMLQKDMPLLVGNGVKIVKDDTMAVSVIAGRPALEGHKNKKVIVLPVYRIVGNVDISVGSISFRGDIEVTGDVLDGFSLTAGKSIIVHGSAIRAELHANEEIIVHKNIISSNVNAGLCSLVLKTMLPELKKLYGFVDSIIKAMRLLKSHQAFKVADLQAGEGRLVQLLIDSKFKAVPKVVEPLIDAIYKNTGLNIEELIIAAEKMKKLTGINPLRIQTEQEVNEILQFTDNAIRRIEDVINVEEQSNVTTDYIQNSVINASGDVLVTGRGVISSDIHAGGNIKVTNPKSVVRGGKIFPGQKALINELGSNTDVICIVRINEGCELEAQLVHPAVTIESSFGRYQFNECARAVKVYVSKNGTLEVEKLKIK